MDRALVIIFAVMLVIAAIIFVLLTIRDTKKKKKMRNYPNRRFHLSPMYSSEDRGAVLFVIKNSHQNKVFIIFFPIALIVSVYFNLPYSGNGIDDIGFLRYPVTSLPLFAIFGYLLSTKKIIFHENGTAFRRAFRTRFCACCVFTSTLRYDRHNGYVFTFLVSESGHKDIVIDETQYFKLFELYNYLSSSPPIVTKMVDIV